MNKQYKGYELMKAIDTGELSFNQRVNSLNLEYENYTIDFVLKGRAIDIMDLVFELAGDKTDIQAIKEQGKVLFLGNDQEGLKKVLNDIIDNQNAMLEWAKKIDKRIGEEKE